jgi:hypothetical protein
VCRETGFPAIIQDFPAHRSGLHIHHAVSRYCGWAGRLQIHWLEDQVHTLAHGNDLATVEAEFLIIVEDCIHVLDPNGIDGAIKDEPFSIWILSLGKGSELDSQDTVGPLMRDLIVEAVQLLHGD